MQARNARKLCHEFRCSCTPEISSSARSTRPAAQGHLRSTRSSSGLQVRKHTSHTFVQPRLGSFGASFGQEELTRSSSSSNSAEGGPWRSMRLSQHRNKARESVQIRGGHSDPLLFARTHRNWSTHGRTEICRRLRRRDARLAPQIVGSEFAYPLPKSNTARSLPMVYSTTAVIILTVGMRSTLLVRLCQNTGYDLLIVN